MRYCWNCNRITHGEPLFCNFCGRSYDEKLCPRHHVNPRHAEACSQCGSRDLSTPQPRVPAWAGFVEFVLTSIPGVALIVVTVMLVASILLAFIEEPRMVIVLALLLVPVAILWNIWSRFPTWFRSHISELFRRRRDGNGGRR